MEAKAVEESWEGNLQRMGQSKVVRSHDQY